MVAVGDSATHPGDLDVAVPAATRLVLLAAGRPDGTLPSGQRPDPVPDGRRPHVLGSLRVTGGPGASVVVDGIVLEGDLVVKPGRLGSLTVSQSTVTGVVQVEAGAGGGNGDLAVSVDRAVLGGIACKGAVRSLTVVDAIVDAAGGPAVTAPGSPLCARGATVRGTVLVRTLEASDCVLDGTVTATHRQAGCLRFSVVGPGSRTPRRFRCVDGARHAPAYASTDPGSPVYLALAATCSAAIRAGGEFEAEMGVHHHLRRPPREAAAVRALAPYAPVQLEIGTFGS